MKESEHVVADYAATSLSLRAYPVSFVRDKLNQLKVTTNRQLKTARAGSRIKVANLVLVRQRPGTAGGVCFMTLRDETGYSNLVVFEKLFDKFRMEIHPSRLMMAEGKLQREGDVIHIIVERPTDLTDLLHNLTRAPMEDLPLLAHARARGDEPSQGFDGV